LRTILPGDRQQSYLVVMRRCGLRVNFAAVVDMVDVIGLGFKPTLE
jgi:hypothetical protein